MVRAISVAMADRDFTGNVELLDDADGTATTAHSAVDTAATLEALDGR